MFAAVVFMFLLHQTSGGSVRFECSDSGNNSLTFTPAADNVKGRYTVELCTLMNPNVTKWNVDLWFYKDESMCRNARRVLKPNLHSVIKTPITEHPNCTYVCYSHDFDLIFGGCYKVQSEFINEKSQPIDEFFIIENNLTIDMFKRNKAFVKFFNKDKDVSLLWILGIPVASYDVAIAPIKENATEYSQQMTDVTDNCTMVNVDEVSCQLALPLGCYEATLQHYPLWASVLNRQTLFTYNFCHTAVKTPVVAGDGSSARVWWACGGALLAAAALLGAALARRALRTRNYHKHVLESWRRARECEAPRVVEPTNHNILLLYAREGDHGQRAVAALKTILQNVNGGQVLDIHSAEVTRLAGAAPGAWLRDVLSSSHVRVLLLQSPAAAALYCTRLQRDRLQLCEPLLGRGAMYRAPQFGDQLLLLALRLISETASEHHHYNKYYLATYGTLETDILQQVVPYRRYVLPAAVSTLARDLSSVPAPDIEPVHLQNFHDCATEFVSHVSDHPDYLMDELIIM